MAATPEEKEHLRRGSRRNVGIVVAVIVIALILVAVAVLAGLFNPSPGQTVTLLGSGATFPFPLITKWSSVYVNETGGRVQVNYQGIGSGAGIQAITAKTVDFAGSDAPLKPSERAAAPGLLHVPETIGAVTAAYNVASLSSGLNLTGHVLGEIFLGKITTWNHANISALNPAVVLPSSTITVVHRSDSSGTTFVWTSYLHLENPGWNSSFVGKSINWPGGIGASGNAGVAGKILTTPDSIGYVELAYTVQNSMKVGKIRNPAGGFISPSLASTAAAAASAPTFPSPDGDWNNVTILNAAGANSYPIASFTYLLVYKELNTIGTSMTQAKAQALVDFLWWCVHNPGGQQYATSLVYPTLPQTVVTLDEQAIRSIAFNGQTLHS
ncbi:MAG: phosphate ABC transporter substrate-binding protein PstS [Methanobacteriota archaeon]|nr:MAG: phosphate ABC transporter substrate-binding protein PstS [Euryarchaeota archaeon]